jgi:hypothetical protein
MLYKDFLPVDVMCSGFTTHYITKKNRIKIFLFLHRMQIHEFYVNIKLVRKRERIENIAH